MRSLLMVVFAFTVLLAACGKEKTDGQPVQADATGEVSGADVCNLCQDATAAQDPGAVSATGADATSTD